MRFCLARTGLVSAIIPARNEEATITRVVESLASQSEIGEIIVVNDQSNDLTRPTLDQLASRIDELKIIDTDGVPQGWIGKNHAVCLGAAAAGGEWLLFTDADTFHLPDSTARALADAAARSADMISYSPEQETHSIWERALIPFVYCRLAKKYSFDRINRPDLPDAAANGQFILIRRDVYEAVRGHAGVAAELVEDVALAHRVKQAGYKLYFASGAGVVRTRMYRSFREMWQGWTKNLFLLMGGRTSAVAEELLSAFPWPVAICLILSPLGRAYAIAALVLFLLYLTSYAVQLRVNRLPVSAIRYYALAACLYAGVLLASAWKFTHGKVIWKGRKYTAKTA